MAPRLTWAFLLLGLASAPAPAQTFDHTHAAWNALLKKHVVVLPGGKASQVRYAALAADRKALKAYLDSLSAIGGEEFHDWSRQQRMAFLINAYNAFMVEKVLTRYPDLRSVWDFGKVFGNPFKDEFFSLLGRRMSLDGIEHGMLRKPGAYADPRIHYAVNCASVGCPMLREEAYTQARIERQLMEQAYRFLSDRRRNRLDPASGKLEVSKIFDWYKEDFGVRENYFAGYAEYLADDLAQRRRIGAGKVQLMFLDYDWALNDYRSSSPR